MANAKGSATAIVPVVKKITSLMATEYATRIASKVWGLSVNDFRFVAPVQMTDCAETALVTLGISRRRLLRRMVCPSDIDIALSMLQ